MSDLAKEIKEKIDLADFLRQYIKLSPAGKNLKALCPFHKEKTPSFMVSPERQTWHCFGSCQDGGDLFKFLMKYENVEFFDALKILAEKAGLDVRRYGSPDQKHHNLHYEINQAAKEFFKRELALNRPALEYLSERGLKKETTEEFEIGFAKPGRDELTRHLINKGFAVGQIEQAGLAFKTDRGTYWDRFRNRVMFPIFNHLGKVVGFTGRVLPNPEPVDGPASNPSTSSGLAQAKYVNSPETPIFNKSKILYGLHKSKNFIRETRSAILVEGQMDFLMLWQDGVKNIVASSGTALTAEHLKSLKPLAENLILIFDNDEAGQNATERAIDLAGENDFLVKVAMLSEKDPADVVKEKPGAMKENVAKAVPAMEYYLQKFSIFNFQFSKLGLAEQKKNLRLVLAKIKKLYSSVERAQWLKEMERRTGISERHLLEEMEKLKDRGLEIGNRELEKETSIRKSRREIVADRLITLAAAKSELSAELEKYRDYLPAAALNPDPVLALRAGLIADNDFQNIQKEFQDLLRQLRGEYWKERRQEARNAIQIAERSGDEARVEAALKEFDLINKELQNI